MKATAHWLELKGHTEKKPSMMFDEVFSEQVFATGKIEDGLVLRQFFARTKQPLFQDWLIALVRGLAMRLPVGLLMKLGLATLFRPRTRGWRRAARRSPNTSMSARRPIAMRWVYMRKERNDERQVQKVAYYPGCALEGTGHAYNRSTKELGKALGLELTELKNWNCCGAMEVKNIDPKLQTYLSARNLSIAEEMGFDTVMAPCNGCYHNLKKAEYDLADDAESREVNDRLSQKAGHKTYETGKVETIHALDWIKEAIGEEGLKARVKNSLKGLKVANYYGCMYTRPRHIFPEKDRGPGSELTAKPHFMDDLLAAAGAENVDYPLKTACCGGAHTLSDSDTSTKLVLNLLTTAEACGADVIATECPTCHTGLEMHQVRAEKVSRPKDLGEDPLLHSASRHGARPLAAQGRRARESFRLFRPAARAGLG